MSTQKRSLGEINANGWAKSVGLCELPSNMAPWESGANDVADVENKACEEIAREQARFYAEDDEEGYVRGCHYAFEKIASLIAARRNAR